MATKQEASTSSIAAALWSDTDERMMRRALELAARGCGQVSPGPLVGCVIVDESDEIVGEGYYLYERIKHAETFALEQAGSRARGATAYVSLEPHAHQGRTPPCTDALINARINRVVAPIEDPNPLVSGQGFAHLRRAGMTVESGLLAAEATQLNEKYLHAIRKQRPFVHLKLACSLDGRIATRTGDARWITGEAARQRVHQLRHEYDAILVGANTASRDDPLLTDRSGHPRHRPLARIVLDRSLRLSTRSRLAQTTRDWPTIVFSSTEADAGRIAALEACGVEVVPNQTSVDSAISLTEMLKELHRRSIHSVLVEGGAQIAGSFLDAKLIDKVSFFIAPLIIGGNDAPPAVGGTGAATLAEALSLHDVQITRHDADLEITANVRK